MRWLAAIDLEEPTLADAGSSMMGSKGTHHPDSSRRGSASGRASRNGSVGGRHAAHPTAKSTSAEVIEEIIASDYPPKRELQKRIHQAIEAHGYDRDTAFGIKLALEEALTNAIKHGNKLDTTKKVKLIARISPSRVEIIVEDEGPGFNRNGVPDPLLDENLEKCSGRGILLIESYMDRVLWSHQGRRLRMIKLKSTPAKPRRRPKKPPAKA